MLRLPVDENTLQLKLLLKLLEVGQLYVWTRMEQKLAWIKKFKWSVCALLKKKFRIVYLAEKPVWWRFRRRGRSVSTGGRH